MHEPNLEPGNWTLDDGEDYHHAHPDTFPIPAQVVREGLERGDYAKLIFRIAVAEDDDAVERMWVIVSQKVAGGYVGILTNTPALIEEDESLRMGTQLTFSARHVIAVLSANDVLAQKEKDPAIAEPSSKSD